MNRRPMKPNLPPLSALDRFLYIVWILGGIVLFLGPLYGLATLRREIAFSDPQVVAINADLTLVLMLPLAFYLLFLLVVWPARMCQMWQPLLGRKDVQYGPPQWASVYPLFSRSKPKGEPQIEAAPWWKKKPLMLGGLFVLLAALALLGLCGRTCLNEDASVRSYNVLNQETAFWSGEEMEELTVRAFYKSGRNGQWMIDLTLTNKEGKSFVFDHRGTEDYELQGLLQVKSCFGPDQVRVDGVEYLDQVIEEWDYDEEDCLLLYQLFGVG